jgi:glycosyltransferase involved in cell wall biosynthesis
MILVFWQNKVSPHQLPYIQCLVKENEVFLVISESVDKEREKIGWISLIDKAISFGIKVYLKPDDNEIKSLIKKSQQGFHFFTGITSFKFVFNAFKLSLKYKINRNIIVEGPFLFNKPKILHILKTFLTDRKYFKYINKVYAIGESAEKWYLFWGFKRDQVIPFIYCVNNIEKLILSSQISGNPKFLFVGNLIKRKGVDFILDCLVTEPSGKFQFDIVGDGVESEKLEFLSRKAQNEINFLGVKQNSSINEIFKNYDCLILPSRHDGWGAVVNEALTNGLFVLVSEKCGSKSLIMNGINGRVFDLNKKSFNNQFNKVIRDIEIIRENRTTIFDWSINSISGKVIAKYFVETINNKDNRIPWKK